MEPILLLASVVLGHVLVWGIVKQMRREGKRVRRFQFAGFVALEVALAAWLVQADSLWLLAWLAANAAMTLVATSVSPPRRRN